MSNFTRSVLYIGITNNLKRRVYEHKNKVVKDGFTDKYECKDLLYFENFDLASTAIKREKQLKNWHREWKMNLIKEENPELLNLSENWFDK